MHMRSLALIVIAWIVATTTSAVAQPATVDLLQINSTTVRVSSLVDNPTVSPQFLVDKDVTTAWNSATGDLVGSWIEVTVPNGSQVDDVQIIVGNTGSAKSRTKKSARSRAIAAAQDWFKMNPRITEVSIWADGKRLGSAQLDPIIREPQSIPVAIGNATTFRIVVDAVVMGSKSTWREVCVSELVVNGKPPSKPTWYATNRRNPVEVSEFAFRPLQRAVDPDLMCTKFLKDNAGVFAARGDQSDTPDPLGPPECRNDELTAFDVSSAWISVSSYWEVTEGVYQTRVGDLIVETDKGFWLGDTIMQHTPSGGGESWELTSVEKRDVFPGAEPELLLHQKRNDDTTRIIICALHKGVPRCTGAIVESTASWQSTSSIADGMLTLLPLNSSSGTIPWPLSGAHSLWGR
jgi:hypothetical protein